MLLVKNAAQKKYWPKTSDSWCFYQKALALRQKPASHKTTKVSFNLEPDQLQRVQDVYTHLTTDVMMKRCLQGFTQNPNESFHSRIWLYLLPKASLNYKKEAGVCSGSRNQRQQCWPSRQQHIHRYGTQSYYHHCFIPQMQGQEHGHPSEEKMRNRHLQKELEYGAESY